jgi:imidazolonepropionase-like amidohydrolase
MAKVFLGVTLLIAGLTHAATAPTVSLALTGAKVYRSPTEPPIEEGTIVIRGGRIESVGASGSTTIPAGAEQIDCHGLVVTAGFWNSHVHVLTPRLLHVNEASASQLQIELDAMFNRWGFTTVFDIASVLDNTIALRRRVASGELRGPNILTTGEPIWSIEPVYVRELIRRERLIMTDIDTPAQAVALVRDHVNKGANGIKLFTGSYQGNGKVSPLPLPVAEAAVREAHRHHLPVFAHPQDVNGVDVAVASGVDVLAHTVPDSPPWDDAFVERLKRARIALVPTLTLFDFEARKGNDADRERAIWVGRMVDQLKAYARANGEVLFGTDVGYTDVYDTGLEFALMSRAGMTYQQILASLTTQPSRQFGYAARAGRIEKGYAADLVVLSLDPGRDPSGFSTVRYTIRNGAVTYTNTR